MEDFVNRVRKDLAAMGPEVALAVVAAEEFKSPAKHALGMSVLAHERRDAGAAFEWASRAVKLSDDPVVLEQLGDACELKGDNAGAEEALRRAVDKRAHRRNLAKLARVLLALGRSDEAEEVFRRILASHPTNMNILHALAVLRQRKDDLAEAATCYARGFEASPFEGTSLQQLANLVNDMSRLHGAFAFASKLREEASEELAVALDLQLVQLAIAMAREHGGRYALGDVDALCERLVSGAARRPVRVRLAIARTLIDLGRAGNAAVLVEPLVGKPMEDPERVLLYVTLGLIATIAKKSDEAIEDFARAVDLDANQIDACARAVSLLLEKNDAPSMARIERLLGRIPLDRKRRSPDLLVREAIYFLRVGRDAEAERDLSEIAALTGGKGETAEAALKLRAMVAAGKSANKATTTATTD